MASKKVFISHAHGDPAWPDADVEALAKGLQASGAEVLLDIWKQRETGHALSLVEWIGWMESCIGQADHVLCLCSATYANSAARHRDQARGYGVGKETTELVLGLYLRKQANEGWLCVLHREGDSPLSDGVVPTSFRGKCSVYEWPAAGEGLRELVGAAPQEQEVQPLGAAERRARRIRDWITSDACKPVVERLEKVAREHAQAAGAQAPGPGGWPALQALALPVPTGEPHDGLYRLARALTEAANTLSVSVYRDAVFPWLGDLVSFVAAGVLQPAASPPLVSLQGQVATAPPVRLSVLAALLAPHFEGRLRFVDSDGIWRPEWCFELVAPANGPNRRDALLRVAHGRFFPPSTEDQVAAQRESRRLSESEIAALKRRIRKLVVQNQDLVMLVEEPLTVEVSAECLALAHDLSETLKVPCVLRAPPAAGGPTLSIDTDEFEEVLQDLMNDLRPVT